MNCNVCNSSPWKDPRLFGERFAGGLALMNYQRQTRCRLHSVVQGLVLSLRQRNACPKSFIRRACSQAKSMFTRVLSRRIFILTSYWLSVVLFFFLIGQFVITWVLMQRQSNEKCSLTNYLLVTYICEFSFQGTHFVELCCQRNVPLLFLQNTLPQTHAGLPVENSACLIKDQAKLMSAVACAQV